MPLKSKILLVDDYPVVRCGLAAWVNGQPDLAVCGEVSSATEAWRQIELGQPDLVVVGLMLEDGSGLDFLQRLKKRRAVARRQSSSRYRTSGCTPPAPCTPAPRGTSRNASPARPLSARSGTSSAGTSF